MQQKSQFKYFLGKSNNSKNIIINGTVLVIEHFCHIKSSKNIPHTKLISIPLCVSYPAKIGPGLHFSCELLRPGETVSLLFRLSKSHGLENKTFYF